jgi:glyoxylase-like metal-dependent hydrolase (beta-lactamase superfamily II)
MSETSWHTPGAYLAAERVFRIPLALPDDGLRAVNAYAIEDDGGLVLVDPGQALPESWEQLARALRSVGYSFADVHMCLVTHAHRDHYTQAIALRRQVGCRVSLGEQEKPSLDLIADPGYGRVDTQLRMLVECGAESLLPELGPVNASDGLPVDIWEQPDEWVADGGVVELKSRSLRVRHTPGHTRGHVGFHDTDAGLLFAGDHVLPHITPSIGFEPAPPELPLADFIRSLERLLECPDASLLPAHGPVRESVHLRVHELLAHHDHRLEQALRRLSRGDSKVYEIASGLGWTRRQRRLDELSPFNQMLAVLETKAHLDVLVEHGHAGRELDGGLLRYTAL